MHEHVAQRLARRRRRARARLDELRTPAALPHLTTSPLLAAGPNVHRRCVADGWYRGRLGFRGGRRDVYGDRSGLLAQLEMTYDDGTVETSTGHRRRDWRGAPPAGPLGQPLRRRDADDASPSRTVGRRRASTTATGWPCGDAGARRRHARRARPARRCAASRRGVRRGPSPRAAGATIVDFGQNLVGRVRFTVHGRARDTIITLRHAEVLEDGELGLRGRCATRAATDRYILAAAARRSATSRRSRSTASATPRSTAGRATLDPTPIRRRRLPLRHGAHRLVRRARPRLLNRLHENVVWSMRGNFVDVPTDCPQRDERLGWTGDIQVFAPTASFLYDCAGMLGSWLADLAAEQREIGTVPDRTSRGFSLDVPAEPAAAWGDAAVVVPVGALRALRRPGRAGARSSTACAPGSTQSPRSAGRRPPVGRSGFQFGDWLDPAAPPRRPRCRPHRQGARRHRLPRPHRATARPRRRACSATRPTAPATTSWRAEVAAAFNGEFVTPTGRMASDAQTAYALALRVRPAADEPEQRVAAAARLAELVRRDDYRIGTGFVGTPLVCDALVDAGDVDDGLPTCCCRPPCPSWLYPVTMGATTIWERWDSMLPDGSVNPGEMTSFNHYALGAVADWLHRTVAGLAPAAPGYRHLLVAPRPGGGLTHAAAAQRTPYGDASVRWQRPGERLVVDVTCPPAARLGSSRRADPPPTSVRGAHRFECPHRPAATRRPSRPAPSRTRCWQHDTS